MSLLTRIQHGWNAFRNNRDPTIRYRDYGSSYTYRPDRIRFTRGNERTIVTSMFNRIAMDVSSIAIRHVQLDENGRYLHDLKTGLNECLTLNPNMDQVARSFMQDVVMSMFDEGCVAIVPVDTTADPTVTDSFDIDSMRTGKVLEWRPKSVLVQVYNDQRGRKEDIWMPKKSVAIIENPFWAVVNEPNSIMKRLVRKLALLDAIDEYSGSGKLDLIVQLPYVVKSPLKKQQADERREDIEKQLSGSTYGIAYIDGTEKITQLNRPVENNLLKQIEYLTSTLQSQMGFHQTILDGTADEKTMLNYTNTTIEPILSVIVDEMKRKFLTKTARSQNKSIVFFRDPFKLVPVGQIAEIADKFTRNEIMTSNEIRQVIGMKPSKDPKADQLVNSNIAQPDNKDDETKSEVDKLIEKTDKGGNNQNGKL